jgi:hypothetical protein
MVAATPVLARIYQLTAAGVDERRAGSQMQYPFLISQHPLRQTCAAHFLDSYFLGLVGLYRIKFNHEFNLSIDWMNPYLIPNSMVEINPSTNSGVSQS